MVRLKVKLGFDVDVLAPVVFIPLKRLADEVCRGVAFGEKKLNVCWEVVVGKARLGADVPLLLLEVPVKRLEDEV